MVVRPLRLHVFLTSRLVQLIVLTICHVPTDIQLSNCVELSANQTPCIMRWGSVIVQMQNAHTCFAISVSPSVWNGLEPTKRNFMKFYVECFYLNLWGKKSSLVKITQNKTHFLQISTYSYDYCSYRPYHVWRFVRLPLFL